MRPIYLVALTLTFGACAVPSYPIDLDARRDVGPEVMTDALSVARDHPGGDADEDERSEALALQGLVANAAPGGLGLPADEERSLRADLEARLEDGEVVSAVFASSFRGHDAWHEVTVGLLPLSLARVRARLDPAPDWGRSLAGWRGGALVVDAVDPSGQPTLQRERMVLAPPWFAVGAPDMDITKYEVVDRPGAGVRILWRVDRSANDSVHLDVGYLVFRPYRAPGADSEERTLVAFESIHEVEPGWLGAILPRALERSTTRRAIRAAFRNHVDRYREVVGDR